MATVKQYVQFNNENNRWIISSTNSERPYIHLQRQTDAIKIARVISQRTGSEMVVKSKINSKDK